MSQKDDYLDLISDDKNMLKKRGELLSDSTSGGLDGTERIVTTLYAIPNTDKPFLTLSRLKKGVYEEASYLSIRSYILFSDIGSAAWRASLEINKNSTIELVQASMLEEDKSWQVLIKNQYLTALVNSVRFKPVGKYTTSFYVAIEIGSKPAPMLAFVKGLMEALNRKPWENQAGELDWRKFAKRTFTPRNEVIEQWALLSDSPELSCGYTEEPFNPLCGRCKKIVDKEWVMCPFCGEPLKDFFMDY